jgi:hypothetical protein
MLVAENAQAYCAEASLTTEKNYCVGPSATSSSTTILGPML